MAAGHPLVPALRAAPGLEQAVEPRDARSLFILGARYADGVGVARDPARARALWQRAAEQGDCEAQTSLGWLLTLGEGGARDPAAAVQWYQRAAVQGHAAGQLYLGLKLRDGEGIARDPVLAYAWIALAAAGEGPASVIRLAISRRDALAGELSPAQLEEARRLAHDWRRGQVLARGPYGRVFDDFGCGSRGSGDRQAGDDSAKVALSSLCKK